jgi:membrane-bound metal-dependent hydrolase YbcI (DUF457 family)
MTYKTHTAFSITFTSASMIAISKLFDYSIVDNSISLLIIIFFSILGGLIPDIDERNSYISTLFPFSILSIFIRSFTKHREITHRFFTVVSLFIITFIIYKYSKVENRYIELGIYSFFLGYLSHLLGDAMTTGGIKRFFYPVSKKTFYFLPKSLRFNTFSSKETIYLFIFSFSSAYLIYFISVNML